MKFPLIVSTFILLTVNSFAKKPQIPLNEDYRPQFHFTSEANYISNPSGLVFYDGEYHLFYQYNPNGNDSGFGHLAHAISNDLVNWQHLPIAVFPENDSKDSINCTIGGGSAIVDINNLTNLKSGNEQTIILFYTAINCGLRMAYSNDRGRTWEKFEGNPILEIKNSEIAGIPKVLWHEPSNKFVMVINRIPEGISKNIGFSIYTSENLLKWEFKTHIPGFRGNPDLVELQINRRKDDKKWVLIDGEGSYILGSFDGETFLPESPKIRNDFGKNFFSTQTWNNIPENDGRTIQIAWLKEGDLPGMPFNGQFTFPCELSLKKYTEGLRLIKKPVKEIEILQTKASIWENKNLIPGINKNILKGIKSDCMHIKGSFKIKTADNFGFVVRFDKKNNGAEILYNTKTNTLSCLGQSAYVEPVDGTIKLDILIDRASIEIYCNDGKVAISSCFTPVINAYGIFLFNTGGELLVEKLEIFPLKSIWYKEK